MKTTVSLFSLLVLVIGLAFQSCQKEDPKIRGCTDPSSLNYNPKANENDGSCQYNGNVTFWVNSTAYNGPIDVAIGNESFQITNAYVNQAPTDCGSAGCATFTLKPGTYSYTAEDQYPVTSQWSGTVTVTSDGCLLMRLD